MAIGVDVVTLEECLARFRGGVGSFLARMEYVNVDRSLRPEADAALEAARQSTEVQRPAHLASAFRASLARLGLDVAAWPAVRPAPPMNYYGNIDFREDAMSLFARRVEQGAQFATLEELAQAVGGPLDVHETPKILQHAVNSRYGTIALPIPFDATFYAHCCTISSAVGIRSDIHLMVSSIAIARVVSVKSFLDHVGEMYDSVPRHLGAVLHNLAVLDEAARVAIASGRVVLVDG